MGRQNCMTRVRNSLLAGEGGYGVDVYLNMALAEVIYGSTCVLPKQLVDAVAQAGNDGRHEYRAQLLATNAPNDEKGKYLMKKTTRQLRREARIRHRRIRSSIFAVIVVGVSGLASFYLVKAFSRPAVEPMAGDAIDTVT